MGFQARCAGADVSPAPVLDVSPACRLGDATPRVGEAAICQLLQFIEQLPRGDRRTIVERDAVGGEVTTTTEGSKQTVLEQLTAEHRRLDEQLRMLERRRVLSPAEQVEITRLKKQKLWTKDQIARAGLKPT
jgi:uncharacterized protein YdcH (DUF465 family)